MGNKDKQFIVFLQQFECPGFMDPGILNLIQQDDG